MWEFQPSTKRTYACSTLNRHEKKYVLALTLSLYASIYRCKNMLFLCVLKTVFVLSPANERHGVSNHWMLNESWTRNAFQYVYLVESRFLDSHRSTKAGYSYFYHHLQKVFLFNSLSLPLTQSLLHSHYLSVALSYSAFCIRSHSHFA